MSRRVYAMPGDMKIYASAYKDHPPIGNGWLELTGGYEADVAIQIWPENHRRRWKGRFYVYGCPVNGLEARELLDIGKIVTWTTGYAEGFALAVEILAREGHDHQVLALLPQVEVKFLGRESREKLIEALDEAQVPHEISRQ